MTTNKQSTTPTFYLADGSPVNHDPFSCECHETCSLCTEVYKITALKPSGEWEFVCGPCRRALSG